MIHRAQRGVMECEPLSGNAGVSFFSSKWKLNIFYRQVFSYTEGKFPLAGSSSIWKSAQRILLRGFEETVWSPYLKSVMTIHLRHSGTRAHFLPPTLKTISTLFRRVSLATVALASQVCLWIPSAQAQWHFSSFQPKPHFQKIVLEEIECEWKADGIEIELRSDTLGHLIQYVALHI